MTKVQLEAVIDELVSIVNSWNDAVADGDRGRANGAICLTLWDDGSGRLGMRSWGNPDHVKDFHEFDDPDGLVKVLVEEEGVELETEVKP